MYRPSEMNELRTPVKLLVPTGVEKKVGVERYIYPTDGDVIFVNWKSFGGTESVVNGILSIIDTATVTTWYRPDIAAKCRLRREDGAVYEIVSEPENIELGGKFCRFKVQRVKGGV